MMKWLGATLVILSCGGLGYRIASAYRYEEQTLRQLIAVLDYMECELQYRLTPLPSLCKQAACECRGALSQTFKNLSTELEDQLSPDVHCCMTAALSKVIKLPRLSYEALDLLGRSLGRFDLPGQLKGLEGVRMYCRRNLEDLVHNRDNRLRSYQTLGLCAGAALAILFI